MTHTITLHRLTNNEPIIIGKSFIIKVIKSEEDEATLVYFKLGEQVLFYAVKETISEVEYLLRQ